MTATQLLLGVLFSSIGLGYFLYGRKQSMTVPLVCGL
ncbi:MAG TPA: amino acid transport protein, partial [Acinetobacter radioresistens]|nr:amino acid transport protein [Acinetobacter radioresistens]